MARTPMVTVTGRLAEFHTGQLLLTSALARPRAHRLTMLGKPNREGFALYEISNGPVQFKHGETFGLPNGVPKGLEQALTDFGAAQAAAEAAAKAAEEAAAAERARVAAEATQQRQHQELVAAMAGMQGDAEGNIALDALLTALAGKINFDPTPEQLEAAWAERAQ